MHPDYILRQRVLDQLRDRWLPLSPAGWHFVVAGLMRENQFEKALEQLEAMERKNIPVENWLHSLIVYIMCDYHEFEEVNRLIRRRVEQGHEITQQLWSHVLCKASEDRHHGMTRYIWQRRVNLGYLRPSEDTCTEAMYVAARFGDHELGRAVFHYLRIAGLKPKSGDHDRLITSLLVGGSDGDLPAALEELCTMHEAGHEPRKTTMKLFYGYIIQGQIDRQEVWQMLKRLKNAKRSIPLAAVEVIAEAWKNDAEKNPSVVDDALAVYRELYTVCPEGANLALYNVLINTCRRGRRPDVGMFLLKEMSSLGVIPDGETFNLVIRMCLDGKNFRSAWMYLQDMHQRGLLLVHKTQTYIHEVCAESMDPDAIRLRYHPSAQLPSNPPLAESVEPKKPWTVWNKEPKPSQATRRRRKRQREATIAEKEKRREDAVASEKNAR